jgi:hypothetical protein
MTYMVVEHFRDGDPVPVYRRFRERGRMLPPGLAYVSSWVDRDLRRCYQLMGPTTRRCSRAGSRSGDDLAEFRVHPVITSQEAAEQVAPRL